MCVCSYDVNQCATTALDISKMVYNKYSSLVLHRRYIIYIYNIYIIYILGKQNHIIYTPSHICGTILYTI